MMLPRKAVLQQTRLNGNTLMQHPSKKRPGFERGRPNPIRNDVETVGTLFRARHLYELYGKFPPPRLGDGPPVLRTPPYSKENTPTSKYVTREVPQRNRFPPITTNRTSKLPVRPPPRGLQYDNESMKPKVNTTRMMGPPPGGRPCPKHFLKKHSKEPLLPEMTEFAYPCSTRKDPLPRWTGNAPLIHQEQDFVKKAIEKRYVTVKPEPARMENKGHREILEESGLVPKYTKKNHYGATPGYLQKRYAGIQKSREDYDNRLKDLREREARKYMSEEQRQVVMQKLMHRWHQVNREYRVLPVCIDNITRKMSKMSVEANLLKIENDMDFLRKTNRIELQELPRKTCFIPGLLR